MSDSKRGITSTRTFDEGQELAQPYGPDGSPAACDEDVAPVKAIATNGEQRLARRDVQCAATRIWFMARPVFGQYAAVFGILFLTGCDPVSLTVFGVGSATGVQHTLNGITYKTFTIPLPQVRTATLASLDRMGIKVNSREKKEGGEVIKAAANDRTIEIEFDALTPQTTRMRTAVRNGLFYDSATGTEIILQTENTLNNNRMKAVTKSSNF